MIHAVRRPATTQPPGPTGLPVVGSLLAMDGDPLTFMTHVARTFGDVASFRIGGTSFVLVSHPALAEELLVQHRDHTIKDSVTRGLDDVLGQGLLTSDGAHWKRQRRRIAPSFQPRHMAAYSDAMVRSAHEHLPAPGEGDIHSAMTAVTLAIVVRTLFGAEPGGELDAIGEILDDLMEGFETDQRTLWRVIPSWVPGAHRVAVRHATQRLDELMVDVVARARADGAEGDDLLCRLMAARDDAGQPMSDHELRDELVTLFLAGHETTALAISYAVWLLAEHPEIQDAVHAELNAVLGGRDATPADLRRLTLLDAVIRETLRLYPPAWALGREVTEPFELGGHPMGVGAQVTVSPWVIHRDPRFWVGADRFRPQRWLRGETSALPKLAWMPFGGGPRVCVGNHFAMMEAGLVLATVLQQRQFTACAGFAPDLLPAVTLRPRAGLRVCTSTRPAPQR